jgi:hypothetical protein
MRRRTTHRQQLSARLGFMAVGERGLVSVGHPGRPDRHNERQPNLYVRRPRGDYSRAMLGRTGGILAAEVATSSPDGNW